MKLIEASLSPFETQLGRLGHETFLSSDILRLLLRSQFMPIRTLETAVLYMIFMSMVSRNTYQAFRVAFAVHAAVDETSVGAAYDD